MPTETDEKRWRSLDERRDLVVPGTPEAYLDFATKQWLSIAQEAINARGRFTVALSGGSTPRALFQRLTTHKASESVDWNAVYLFWSDERTVPLTHKDANYRMAMEAGFTQLAVTTEHIFPLHGEGNLETQATAYEAQIRKHVPEGRFDLLMLGMGDDGHTASLFPATSALEEEKRWVLPNWVEEKQSWRLTFSFPLIHRARHLHVYVMGAGKADTLHAVLKGPHKPLTLPSQRLGTSENKALWIVDEAAAAKL